MVCRLCEQESNLIDLFSGNSSQTILLYIYNVARVEIKEDDVASKQICKNCLQHILNMTLFRYKAIITDRKLQGKSGKDFDDFPQELVNNITNSKLMEMPNKLIAAKRNVSTQTLPANILTLPPDNENFKICDEVAKTRTTATQTNLDDHIGNESVTTCVPEKQNSELKHKSIRLLQNLYPKLIIPSNLDKFDMLPIVQIGKEDLNKRRREFQGLDHKLRLKRRKNEAYWDVSKVSKVARMGVPEKEQVLEGAKQESFVPSLGLLPVKRPELIIAPTQYTLTAIPSTEQTLSEIPSTEHSLPTVIPTEPTLTIIPSTGHTLPTIPPIEHTSSTISATETESRIASLDSLAITSTGNCVPSSLPLTLITRKKSNNEVGRSLFPVKTAYHPTCQLCDKYFGNTNIYTKYVTCCPGNSKDLHVKIIKLDDDGDLREMFPDIIQRNSKSETSPKIIQFEEYTEEIVENGIVKKNLSISIHSDEKVTELQNEEDDNVAPQIDKNIHPMAPKPNKEITLKKIITAARRKMPITAAIKHMRVEKLTNVYTVQQPSQQQTCIEVMKSPSYQTVPTKSVPTSYSWTPVLYVQASQAMSSTAYRQVPIQQPQQIPKKEIYRKLI